MGRISQLLMAATVILCSQAWSNAAASNIHCSHLREFERARFETGSSARRWVELHWVGQWLDLDQGWGLACVHSEDQASTRLCDWLSENSSSEFPELLPVRILECHGYRFPPHRSWAAWRSDVTIYTGAERALLLEINFLDIQGETGAIRFSAFAPGQRDAAPALPPLAQLRSGDAGSERRGNE